MSSTLRLSLLLTTALGVVATAQDREADPDWEKKAAQAGTTEQGFYGTSGARDTNAIPKSEYGTYKAAPKTAPATKTIAPTKPAADDPDWEKKAAQAATTTQNFSDTNGARDTSAIPVQQIPAPTSPTVQSTAASSAAADSPEITQLKQQIETARVEHKKVIDGLQRTYDTNKKLYDDAKQRKTAAAAALKTKNANKSIFEQLIDDDETNRLQAELGAAETAMKTYSGKLNNVGPLISKNIQDGQRYEQRLQLDITKADPTTLAAEKMRRTNEGERLATRVDTKVAQLEIGNTKFNETVKVVDKLIIAANQKGQSGIAEALAADQQQMKDAHIQWQASQESVLKTFKRDMDNAYQANRDDDIGPTNNGALRFNIRDRARDQGKDPATAVNFIDADAVVATANSSSNVAWNATGNTVQKNDMGTFAADVYSTNLDTLLTDPGRFVTRYGAYAKGSATAAKDGVVDLFVLGVELVDTGAEMTELALNSYGVNVNIAGRENLETIYTGTRAVGALLDSDDPEGGRIAQSIVDRATAARNAANRYVEQQAASGKKGEDNMLNKTGYVVTTVAGGEEAVFAVFGKTFKVAKAAGKADGAGTLGKVDELADAGKAGKAPEAGTPGTKPARAADNADNWLSDTIDPELRAIAVKQSNMVPEHIEEFSKVAQESNSIILFRPVNQHSTALIKGDAATKGMNIKGKSSDWGPQKGLIPIDPMYSKMAKESGELAEGVTPKKIREYHELNKKALGQEWFKLEDGKWKKQKPQKAIAQELEIDGPNGKKIKVLADFSDPPRAITADYDLLAVADKRGSGGLVTNPDQVAEMGNIGHNEVTAMNKLNDAAKKADYKGGNVVHHGAANRFANIFEAADFPITALLPNGDIKLIWSPRDLRKVYEKYANLGYKLDHMPGWDFGDVTDAEKAARKASATAKRKARAAKEAKEAADLAEDIEVAPGKNLAPVLAGKAIQNRESTGQGTNDPNDATSGAAAVEGNEEDASDEEQPLILVGGDGEISSPVDPINFAFGPSYWVEEAESWVSLPKETYVSLGGGIGFQLEGGYSLEGVDAYSSEDLKGDPVKIAVPATAPPRPAAQSTPTPRPAVPTRPTTVALPSPTPTPVQVTPPPQVSTPAPPPVKKPPEARISTSTGGTIHLSGYSFACFSIRFAGDVEAGDKVGVAVSGPGGQESYDETLDVGYKIGIRHKIYSYGDYGFRVNYITNSDNEQLKLQGNMSGSHTVDSSEKKEGCN